MHAVAGRDPVRGIAAWRRRAGALGLAYTIPELGPSAKLTDRGAAWRKLRLVLRPDGTATTARVTAITESGATITMSRDVTATQARIVPVTFDLPPTRRLSLGFEGGRPFVDAMAVESARGVSFSPVVLRGLHQTWLLGVDEEIFAGGYRAYAPDLVIFQFGVNESHSMLSRAGGFSDARYEKQLRDFYARLRRALPNASILLLGPWERMLHGRVYPAHTRVREIQKRTAFDMGLAYFDGFRFTGGTQGLLRMARAGLIQSDLTHTSYPGGHYLADGLYDELMRDYRAWRER